MLCCNSVNSAAQPVRGIGCCHPLAPDAVVASGPYVCERGRRLTRTFIKYIGNIVLPWACGGHGGSTDLGRGPAGHARSIEFYCSSAACSWITLPRPANVPMVAYSRMKRCFNINSMQAWCRVVLQQRQQRCATVWLALALRSPDAATPLRQMRSSHRDRMCERS